MSVAFGWPVAFPVNNNGFSSRTFKLSNAKRSLQLRRFNGSISRPRPVLTRRICNYTVECVATSGEDTASNPLEWIFENPSRKHLLDSGSIPSTRPILLYICGLGAEPLPPSQASRLRAHYEIVSLAHAKHDTSDWNELVKASISSIANLRSNAPSPITIVAESFGAVFALRIVAAAPEQTFLRQILINPATALLQDSLLLFICSILPLLRVDPSHRIAYKLTAAFFFQNILTNEHRLAASSIPDDLPWLRSVDIDRVPLSALLHRISLLTKHEHYIDDGFLRDHITLPTTLVASARDRLLQSASEVERLAKILPNMQQQIILPYSAHTALFERDVDLLKILQYNATQSTSEDPKNDTLRGHHHWSRVRYEAAVDLGKSIYEPWRRLTSPKVYGRGNVTNAFLKSVDSCLKHRPVLLVGNHGSLGVLDSSLLYLELLSLLDGRRIRPLAAATHFEQFGTISSGRWTRFVKDLGAVQATPRNFCKLLSKGDIILLFPGGGREVCRRRGEEYTLHWQANADFVRFAAKFDALIVPFSAVGADDAVNILLDGQELQQLPVLGPFLQNFLDENGIPKDNVMPLTSFPRADRFYFKFHDIIDTADVDTTDKKMCAQLFQSTQRTVQEGLDELLEIRKRDPQNNYYIRTLRKRFGADGRFSSAINSAVNGFLSDLLL